MAKKGKLFIISAPSGSGKTTLCGRLIKSARGMARSVSMTTRPPRQGEKSGKDYIFVTKKEFEKYIKSNSLLEWVRNFGYYYGTPKDKVLKLLAKGKNVILAIDVKGAMKIKRLRPESVLIFIVPPSIAELKKRLKRRKADSRGEISGRIKIAKRELSYLPRYTYSVVNNDIEEAAGKLKAIIIAERHRVK
ncbi:MAG: guanylate kinase [Candidatus Omnitrophota bacterium]|nr:guanylate kinase [Candidatus Omnitrophota bacterium]